MLIDAEKEAFDSPDYLYELKNDGIRCIAYLSGEVDLRNKLNIALTHHVPELSGISGSVTGRVILDGELAVVQNAKTVYELIQKRALMTHPFKINLEAKRHPACFIAMDILYRNGEELVQLPLTKRKEILAETVHETPLLAVSRIFEGQGIALFNLTTQMGLEGIVAKRKSSQYHYGKKTKDWVKSKNFVDEDFLACGYLPKHPMISLILGQMVHGGLIYKGHVTLGVTMQKLSMFPTSLDCPFPAIPDGHDHAVWFTSPLPQCTVVYMERISSGGMRQPRLKRISIDLL